MIYCGSGSDFRSFGSGTGSGSGIGSGSSSRSGSRFRQYLEQVFNKQKNVKKFLLFQYQKQH
jgi:hypothetical protein